MELRHTAKRDGRLSSFLKQELGLSTGLMNKLKWNEKLFVNGIPRHADYSVQTGDVITALLDEEKPLYPAEEGAISVLFEDEHLLCVEKPAGMLIHPSRSANSGTLANFVAYYFEQTGQNCAFHPITRLDRDTFGVVLLAKNAHIHALCNDLHNKGLLEKTYEAQVLGRPDRKEGEIDAPIARKPLPSLLREVSPTGKPSLTAYRLLKDYGNYSILSLRAITGRTHQLRVHCAYMGFPILGDPQYGNEESRALSEQMGYTTQRLCARSIAFPHPITGEQLCIRSKQQLF